MNVGFIGLGIMGQSMAANLLRAGFRFGVYNRTASKCEALANAGARTFRTPAELAAGSDVVVTMVSDTPDVEEVLFGAEGAANSLRPGSVAIDMSTISPRATEKFAERLRSNSIEMLDAPVSGGQAGAKAGTLSIMVGGPRDVFERCRPLLEAMGKRITWTGPNGSGQKTKLVNQIAGAISLLATVEALRVVQASGLMIEETHKALSGGTAASWMLEHLGPKIMAGDFEPGFNIRLQTKDLRLAEEFVRELGIDAPGTSLVHSLFETAMANGLENQGNQGLYNLWRKSHRS